ncbi:MAG: NYN domain-containing protein [Butyrivibrio sp.]|nr:NYN domain-containing protein [Muribaculum sp.]MCM1552961.1 NYN domain-containing protein [Butyrivibrio sp.]
MEHLAVLIDAENVGAKYVKSIFDELDKNGYDAPCRRIYGNWAKSNGWKENVLLEYSIIPIQQFSYTVGKNSTDMAMVIDAMDLLYQDKVDGFCLITSDSDFTRLAMRLREENKFVFGMGESKAPMALTHACDKFIFLDLIGESGHEEKDESASDNAESHDSPESLTSIETLESAIFDMLNEDGDGEVGLSAVGSRLGKKFPDFDVRNYGYSKLSVFFQEKMQHIELVKRDNQYVVRKGRLVEREQIEQEILNMIQRKGGRVDNLSVIYNELLRKYSGLDIRDYGYGKVSSFLRSMKELEVVGNRVSLKKKKKG